MSDYCSFPELPLQLIDLTVNLAGFVGLAASVVLLRRSLGGSQRNSILGRWVTWLAISDIAVNIWNYLPPLLANRTLLRTPTVPSELCSAWVSVMRALQLWFAQLSACIGLSILFALQRWGAAVKCMRYAPAVSLPLAVLINIPSYLHRIQDAEPLTVPEPVCNQQQYAFIDALTILFFLILGIHSYGHFKLLKACPGSVAKRAYLSASRYVWAFLATWFFAAVTILFDGVRSLRHIKSDSMSCSEQWVARNILYMMTGLSGLFNLIACRDVSVTCAPPPRVVRIGSASVQTISHPSADSSMTSAGPSVCESEASADSFHSLEEVVGTGGIDNDMARQLLSMWAAIPQPPSQIDSKEDGEAPLVEVTLTASNRPS